MNYAVGLSCEFWVVLLFLSVVPNARYCTKMKEGGA